jgi:hypothetical protein
LRCAIDRAELEPGVLKQGDSLGEPLVRQCDRMTLQRDVNAKVFLTAAAQRATATELALGGRQLSLRGVARLGERAALLLEQPKL